MRIALVIAILGLGACTTVQEAPEPVVVTPPRPATTVVVPAKPAPVANPRRCFAVILYGGHEAGTDLDRAERDLLGHLAKSAEIAYAQVEDDTLRNRIAALERKLKQRGQRA